MNRSVFEHGNRLPLPDVRVSSADRSRARSNKLRRTQECAVLAFTLILASLASATHAADFNVDVISGVFPEPSSVGVTLAAPIVGSAADDSRLQGQGVLALGNDNSPFGFGQITELVVELSDGMELELAGFTATTDPGATRVVMIEPGNAGEVSNGQFSQFENLFQFEGFINLSTENEPFDLSEVAPVMADLEPIQLARVGNEIQANVSFDLEFVTSVQAGFLQVPVTINVEGSVRLATTVEIAGDYDGDGLLTIDDLNQLAAGIRAGDFEFDINADSRLDVGDLTHWVQVEKRSWFGDANLDGEFSSEDLVSVFRAGEYEDDLVGNSDWSTGDFNGDQEFDSSDFVQAFRGGGYELGPREAAMAVPEPSSIVIGLISLLTAAHAFRSRNENPFSHNPRQQP